MATRTITHLYDTYDEAARAVQALEAAGVAHSDISLVGSQSTAGSTLPAGGSASAMTGGVQPLTGTDTSSTTTGATAEAGSTGAGAGATLGTVLGGGAGLLAGIGALAIPGVGPVVAAGWLIATLTGAGAGAAAGGLLGGLTGAGVKEADAHVYAEGVARGGTLVSVRADEQQAAQIEQILGNTQPVNIAERGRVYREGGWQAFDPSAVRSETGTTTTGTTATGTSSAGTGSVGTTSALGTPTDAGGLTGQLRNPRV